MPFKKQNSPFWKIQIHLPVFGQTATLSSQTKNKRLAERMEASLFRLAEIAVEQPRYVALIAALKPVKQGNRAQVTPMQIHNAILNNSLQELLDGLNDKPLKAILDSVPSTRDIGRRAILKFAPHDAKFSWMKQTANVQFLIDQYQNHGLDGNRISGNSVYRHLYQYISNVLKSQLGAFERDRILADIKIERENDTRTVTMSIEEIHRLISAIQNLTAATTREIAETRLIVLISVNTSADIRPIISTPNKNLKTVQHDGDQWGILELVNDKMIRKNGIYQPRNRAIPIRPDILPDLRSLITGEHIFTIKQSRFYTLFKRARAAAKLEHIRPKDLRAVFSHIAEDAGIQLTTIQMAMGHERLERTTQYLQHDKTFSPADAAKIMQIFPIKAASA